MPRYDDYGPSTSPASAPTAITTLSYQIQAINFSARTASASTPT